MGWLRLAYYWREIELNSKNPKSASGAPNLAMNLLVGPFETDWWVKLIFEFLTLDQSPHNKPSIYGRTLRFG